MVVNGTFMHRNVGDLNDSYVGVQIYVGTHLVLLQRFLAVIKPLFMPVEYYGDRKTVIELK